MIGIQSQAVGHGAESSLFDPFGTFNPRSHQGWRTTRQRFCSRVSRDSFFDTLLTTINNVLKISRVRITGDLGNVFQTYALLEKFCAACSDALQELGEGLSILLDEMLIDHTS